VGRSEAVGERLEEAKHINRSLAALGDVMAALAAKAPHVPFRNSKLTQLLQDSLAGQAKAMMFIHIAPEVRPDLVSQRGLPSTGALVLITRASPSSADSSARRILDLRPLCHPHEVYF